MDYSLYWDGDPEAARYYREAEEFRAERANREMWLQGLYNYRAFEAPLAMFSWGLDGGKGIKPEGYLERPYAFTKREKDAEQYYKEEQTRKWFEGAK